MNPWAIMRHRPSQGKSRRLVHRGASWSKTMVNYIATEFSKLSAATAGSSSTGAPFQLHMQLAPFVSTPQRTTLAQQLFPFVTSSFICQLIPPFLYIFLFLSHISVRLCSISRHQLQLIHPASKPPVLRKLTAIHISRHSL